MSDRTPIPQPWHVGSGSIIAYRSPSGTMPCPEDLAYYGGYLVAEGIAQVDAEFIITAIRQRDILWRALYAIGLVANEDSRNIARQAWEDLSLIELQVGMEGDAHRAITSILRSLIPVWPYDPPKLTETATRARVEPTGFCYWPSGQFVTDNIELDWANMGNGRCDTTPFYDFDKVSGKWQRDEDGALGRRCGSVAEMYRSYVMPHSSGPRGYVPGSRAQAFIESCMPDDDDINIPF